MLMTGHFFIIDNEEDNQQHEPLFVAQCEQVLTSTVNMPANFVGPISSTTLQFVLTDRLNISEISSKLVLFSYYLLLHENFPNS